MVEDVPLNISFSPSYVSSMCKLFQYCKSCWIFPNTFLQFFQHLHFAEIEVDENQPSCIPTTPGIDLSDCLKCYEAVGERSLRVTDLVVGGQGDRA